MVLSLDKLLADKENLERILDSLMEGIIAHDKERRILYFNREAERITGYTRNEILGRDCHEVFGGPFCGARCSFCGQTPNAWTQLNYPLNILAKGGEARRIEMSVAGMTVVTMQDLMGLGEEARMNMPGRPGGNWGWRFTPEMLTSDILAKLKEMTEAYGR